MTSKDELASRFLRACTEVKAAEAELTDIDARFGDADHGLTMTKIATAIEGAITTSDGSVKDMLDDAAMAVLTLNGGSAVPLWNTWLDAMQEAAPDDESIDESQIKAMFSAALEELADMSGAHVGDKTMMDAVIPATEALVAAEGDTDDLFAAAAAAALAGAEATKQVASKFGRAKSYGTQTIGTPDAGAVSMARFFKGLALV